MILRCTAKLLALLDAPRNPSCGGPTADDWYANQLWIDRRKCLLLTHAGTLFSVFVPDVRAVHLRSLGRLLVPRIHAELAAEDLPADTFGALDPDDLFLAKTADRSVLGCMNDLTQVCLAAVEHDGGLNKLDLATLHHRLQRNLSSARGYVPAIDLIRELG